MKKLIISFFILGFANPLFASTSPNTYQIESQELTNDSVTTAAKITGALAIGLGSVWAYNSYVQKQANKKLAALAAVRAEQFSTAVCDARIARFVSTGLSLASSVAMVALINNFYPLGMNGYIGTGLLVYTLAPLFRFNIVVQR